MKTLLFIGLVLLALAISMHNVSASATDLYNQDTANLPTKNYNPDASVDHQQTVYTSNIDRAINDVGHLTKEDNEVLNSVVKWSQHNVEY